MKNVNQNDFFHSDIDISNASKEQIKSEILRLEKEQIKYSNIDLALKKFLVSSYGSLGYSNFILFDPKIAETITAQGQDIIKFVANAINKYFKEKWHLDIGIHNLMNITVNSNIEKDVVIYIATDSCFVCFEEIIKSSDYKENHIDFITNLYNFRLKKYLTKVFEIYSEKFNVENIQFMKMESISKSGIWLGKNRYILDVVWEQGNINHDSLTNIVAKGNELIQKDTPSFIRKKIKNVINFILKEGKELDMNNLAILIRKIKNEYKLQDVENISFNIKLNEYDKFVLEDQIKIILTESCPIHIRAAAIHNYKLNQNEKYKKKYKLLYSGDNIKYYYSKSEIKNDNVFAFNYGSFPIEFAPEFDYDLMFLKTLINPINKILNSINLPILNENLVVVDKWF